MAEWVRYVCKRGRFPGGLGACHPDEGWQAGYGGRARDGEAVAEVSIERDAELGAGFGQTQGGLAGGFAIVADRSPGDFSFGDPCSDGVFRPVGVGWDFGTL